MKLTDIQESSKESTSKKDYVTLKPGETTILEASGNDYENGLIVKLLKDGGYEVSYWYNDSSKAYPIEVKVDGKPIKKDAKKVSMLFHPEKKK